MAFLSWAVWFKSLWFICVLSKISRLCDYFAEPFFILFDYIYDYIYFFGKNQPDFSSKNECLTKGRSVSTYLVNIVNY